MERTLHSILGVAVVFHPTLIDPIDHLPPTTGDSFQNQVNILHAISESPSDNSREIYPVPKTPLYLFSFSGKKAPILTSIQQKTAITKGV